MNPILRAAIAALALAASSAFAGNLAELQVISRSSGQSLPVYAHGGKLYIAGQPGERYSVRVANRTSRRMLAVVSVDGVNVVSGETAAPDQTGYVFAPWQSYDIAGWRKTGDEVAAFYFTVLPDSYAARSGRPADIGVIGLAVFREWTPPRPRPLPYPRSMEGAASFSHDSMKAERSEELGSTAEAPAASDAAGAERTDSLARRRQAEKIGTGHGEREHSAVSFTDFRRASAQPNEVITLYYDRYENLVARGIIPGAPQLAQPRPFPGAVRFVPDP